MLGGGAGFRRWHIAAAGVAVGGTPSVFEQLVQQAGTNRRLPNLFPVALPVAAMSTPTTRIRPRRQRHRQRDGGGFWVLRRRLEG
jgi:hypothetical protein